MINTQQIFDTKAKQYGIAQDSEDFLTAFIFAVTRTLEDLRSQKVGVDVDDISSLDQNIDIDDMYLGVIVDGIDFYLSTIRQWGMAPKIDMSVQYQRSLNSAHTKYRNSIAAKTRLGL